MVSSEKGKIKFPDLSIIIDYFFPIKCPVCGESCDYGDFICKKCKKNILSSFKLREGIINKRKYYYGFDYNDDFRKILISYKYDRKKRLKRDLAFFLNMIIEKINIKDNSIIVPVPMSRNELKKRKFNHLELILQSSKKPFRKLLIKRKETERQVGLSREQRLKNMKGAFDIVKVIRGKKIYIFDDIITTGASFFNAAACFPENEVYGIMLAHGGKTNG